MTSADTTGMPKTTRDSFLDGRLLIEQPREGYRAAIDPLFLAAATPVLPGQRLLELGCGVGTASCCLLARLRSEAGADRAARGVTLFGLEAEPLYAELARRNARANGFADNFRVVRGNLLSPPPLLEPVSFDGVFFNPPYDVPGRGRPSPRALKAAANHEGSANLTDWIEAALKLLKPKGRITLIQRGDRLGELLGSLEGRAGDIAVLPLYPGAAQPAKRVLVSAAKGSRAPLRLLPGITLHQADGTFSDEANAVLRDAKPLFSG